MQILILGINYAPELTAIGPFTTGLAEHLVAQGHGVTVGTTFPHFPEWRFTEADRGRWRQSEVRNGVDVRRTRVYLPHGRRSVLGRIAYDTSISVGALLSAFPGPRPDIVFCVSPPIQLGLTAALLARRWGVPMVLQVKDLPLDLAMAVGMMRQGLAVRAGRLLERLVYGLADHILVISDGFRDKVLAQGARPEKVQRIPDWVDLSVIRPSPPVPELRTLMGAGPNDLLVLHAGNMGEKQGLDNALEAARLLEGRLPYRLMLMGDGMDRPRLESIVAAKRIANVGFLPLQPASMFPDLLASADVLLLNQRAQVVDSVAPSKLLSYLASGRPVVAAVNVTSEAARLVSDAGAGLIVAPEQPAALAEAYRTLAGAPERRAAMGMQGRRFVERHYARDAVLGEFEALFAQLTPTPNSPLVAGTA